jgi:hypothetical protein
MKRTNTTTSTNNEQFLKLIPGTALQDLSNAESQAIQGGVLIGLLLPAVQKVR